MTTTQKLRLALERVDARELFLCDCRRYDSHDFVDGKHLEDCEARIIKSALALLGPLEEEMEGLRGMLEHSDELLRQAGDRVGIQCGSDNAEWLADEILGLRQEIASLKEEIAKLKDADSQLRRVEAQQDEITSLEEEMGRQEKLFEFQGRVNLNLREEMGRYKESIEHCRTLFNDIKGQHMDCDCSEEEHEMFRIADEGNTYCHDALSPKGQGAE